MENKMNQSKQKRILLRAVIIVVCLAGYIMLVRVLNSVEKTEMVSMKGYSYQKAVVTEVVRDNLTNTIINGGTQNINNYGIATGTNINSGTQNIKSGGKTDIVPLSLIIVLFAEPYAFMSK